MGNGVDAWECGFSWAGDVEDFDGVLVQPVAYGCGVHGGGIGDEMGFVVALGAFDGVGGTAGGIQMSSIVGHGFAATATRFRHDSPCEASPVIV